MKAYQDNSYCIVDLSYFLKHMKDFLRIQKYINVYTLWIILTDDNDRIMILFNNISQKS